MTIKSCLTETADCSAAHHPTLAISVEERMNHSIAKIDALRDIWANTRTIDPSKGDHIVNYLALRSAITSRIKTDRAYL